MVVVVILIVVVIVVTIVIGLSDTLSYYSFVFALCCPAPLCHCTRRGRKTMPLKRPRKGPFLLAYLDGTAFMESWMD